MTTSTVDAQAAKRTRRTTTKATSKAATTEAPQEAPSTGEAPAAKRTRKTASAPVTVRKVALGVQDLARSLYDDALARVGGDPRNLYRVKVLSRSAYEMDLSRRMES